MKKLYALTALSALLIATPATAADDSVSNKAESTYQPGSNGGYELKDTVEHTNANGTTTTQSTDKKVDVDSNGNKSTSVDTKTTKDPKGLMNKTTTETHDKTTQKDGKTEHKHKETVDGATTEESDEKR